MVPFRPPAAVPPVAPKRQTGTGYPVGGAFQYERRRWMELLLILLLPGAVIVFFGWVFFVSGAIAGLILFCIIDVFNLFGLTSPPLMRRRCGAASCAWRWGFSGSCRLRVEPGPHGRRREPAYPLGVRIAPSGSLALNIRPGSACCCHVYPSCQLATHEAGSPGSGARASVWSPSAPALGANLPHVGFLTTDRICQ